MHSGRPVAGSPEHKSMWRRQLVTVAIVLGVILLLLLAALYVCLFRSVPLRISKETTFITGPLKAGGKEVDYFAAWVQEHSPKIMATDENGYRLIVRHFGLPAELEPERVASVCERLGLRPEDIRADVSFEPDDEYLDAYFASADYDESLVEALMREKEAEDALVYGETEEPDVVGENEADEWERDLDEIHRRQILTEQLCGPWTLDDLPMMETWLAENSEALDLVARAASKPAFMVPVSRGAEEESWQWDFVGEGMRLREFARGLCARAYFRIGTGDLDGAIDDILGIRRLGVHLQRSDRSLPMLVGIASEGIGCSVGLAGSLDHPPTNEQIRRLLNESRQFPPPAPVSQTLRFDRFTQLDAIQTAASAQDPLFYEELSKERRGRFACDWSIVATRMNEHFDALLAGSRVTPVALRPIDQLSIRKRSMALADSFTKDQPTVYEALEGAMNRRACVERMQSIVLAMLLYHNDHGALPPAHTVDAEGKPLHSWRVLLLPYLGQQGLYDKIRLDEPWDSPHNRVFHEADVPFYQCPAADLTAGRTTYAVVVGPNVPFEGAKAKSLSDFGPKSGNMILVVECQQDLCWMDPGQDVPESVAALGMYRPDGGNVGIGSPHPGGANFGLRSGAVSFISETVHSLLFEAILQGKSDRIP